MMQALSYKMPALALYAIDWHAMDVDEAEEEEENGSAIKTCQKRFLLLAFCRDQTGRSVVLHINGFQPDFYVSLPPNMSLPSFTNYLRGRVKRYWRDALTACTLVQRKPFYGFSGGPEETFPFAKLTFSCVAARRQFLRAIDPSLVERFSSDGLKESEASYSDPFSPPNSPVGYHYQVYESNLPPLLRFLHSQDLRAAGWMQVKSSRPRHTNTSTCNYELETDYREVIAGPDSQELPSLVYAGFDLEADSSHGDFPLAKKDYQKLAQDLLASYREWLTPKQLPVYRRAMVAAMLHYAFREHYVRLNLQPVRLSSPITVNLDRPNLLRILELGPVATCAPTVYAQISRLAAKLTDTLKLHETVIATTAASTNAFVTLEPADQPVMLALLEDFETYGPVLDTQSGCDYYSVAERFLKEIKRLRQIKYYTEHSVSLLTELIFDPFYNGLINKVYVTRPVAAKVLECLISPVFNLCEQAETARKRALTLKGQGKGNGKDTRHLGTTEDPVTDAEKHLRELIKTLNRHLPKVHDDRVIQIGTIFKRYGASDPYLKHIITLRSCEPIARARMIDLEYDGVVLPNKEVTQYLKAQRQPVPTEATQLAAAGAALLESRRQRQYLTDEAQVIVESYDTEEELLLAWTQLIKTQDPDLLVGYNIFGFDWKYLYERAEQLGIAEQFSQLGRFAGQACRLERDKKLQSAGMGDNELSYVVTTGRISIDLYKVVQRMYSFESYKLDSVCKELLNKQKVDLPPDQIFILQRGDSNDRRTIAEYCLIDCVLCIRLLDKLELIINNIGMAQVCSVPLSFLFLRGQGIKLFSSLAKKCTQSGYLIPVLPKEEGGKYKYEGAIVLEPEKGIHYKPVAVADFNSLYPSCMISENLSHNSYIGSKIVNVEDLGSVAEPEKHLTQLYRGVPFDPTNLYETELVRPDGRYAQAGYDYTDIVYALYKEVPVAPGRKKLKSVITAWKICRWVQPPNGQKDLVPTLLQTLLKARKQSKEARDKCPEGSFAWALYEGLQLAYKVTANSFYGITGARTSDIRLVEIAACTTAVGRRLIHHTADFVRTNYAGARIVYGDTDSVFCQFAPTDRWGRPLTGLAAIYKSMLLCAEAAYLISTSLRPPHNLEFEKAIWPFVLISKKRYHGHYYTDYGHNSFYPKSMGIVLKRRDNAPVVKHVFGGMIKRLMEEESPDAAIQFVQEETKKILAGQLPLHMFIITRTLRSGYKKPEQIAHNVLAQRIAARDPGNRPQSNDRIPYVFVVNPMATLQGERIENPDFAVRHKLPIDYGYYVSHQISKPVTQIFALAGKGEQIFEQLLTAYQQQQEGQTRLIKTDPVTGLTQTVLGIRLRQGGGHYLHRSAPMAAGLEPAPAEDEVWAEVPAEPELEETDALSG